MKTPCPILIFVTAASLLAACATQTKEQLAAIRAARVSPATVQKLEHRGVLTPKDLIELKRRHVDDSVALRQIDRVGIDYILTKSDVQALRDNGVSRVVIQATIRAGHEFRGRYYDPGFGYGYGYGGWGGPWGYPYQPYFYDPWWGTGYSGYYGYYGHWRH